MAKGNLFLGLGRGKVGDLVFYRQYGEQVTRSRNRSPRNPNSYKQRVQRAVMASVSRLYSLGYIIFDHAMEGRQVGQPSQSLFVQRNVAILRAKVLAELAVNIPRSESLARLGAPGVSVAVPFDGMLLSQGSYAQTLFVRDTSGSDIQTTTYALPESSGTTDTISAYAQRNGMVAGDIYTVLCIGVTDSVNDVMFDLSLSSDSDYGRIFKSSLFWVQFRVKASALTDTTVIGENTSYASFFDVVSNDGVDYSQFGYRTQLEVQTFMPGTPRGVIGIIRSRDDSPLRSESYAYFSGQPLFGLTPDLINQAWNKELTQGGSDLILEGADFSQGEA